MDEKSSITSEIEKRLDDIFNEEEVSVSEEGAQEIESSPLFKLKEIILSIDWEISDEAMSSLLKEAEMLKGDYGDDKMLTLFLDLMISVGKYIQKNKANSHPDAIKLLNSIYGSLEKIILTPDISSKEKKKALFLEINRFKRLKEKITERKKIEKEMLKRKEEYEEKIVAGTPVEEAQYGPIEPQAESGHSVHSEVPIDFKGMAPHEAFAFALEEIRKLIKAEFQAIRAELRLWRETKK